ncbi:MULTISPECIES: hypothetical protein [Nocardiaceae]|uniref:hypothetical protein n=1 Tax=Nocardiaceae TaxID=85025 RepID=UPI001E603730|nr:MULTISPECIES: hypothetical protein [Rhodococcus]
MSETFFADPRQVAGLGRLTAEIGQQTLTSYRYFNDHGQLTGVDNGELFGSLAVTFDALRDVWRDRHVHLATNCAGLGDKLNTAAWLYADQEKENYEALNAHTDLVPVPYPDPG